MQVCSPLHPSLSLSWGQMVWSSENASLLPLIEIPRVGVSGELRMGLPLAWNNRRGGVLRLGRQVGQSLEDGSRGLGLHPAPCGSLGKVFSAALYCHFWKDLYGCLGIKMGQD